MAMKGAWVPFFLFYYSVLLAIPAVIHACALYLLPHGAPVSVIWRMDRWILSNELSLSVLYMFFPLMLFAQYWFLKFIPHGLAVRLLAVAGLLSGVVAIYQLYVDPSFLFFYPYERCVGLAADASALGLTLFLLTPIAFIGIASDRNRFFKLLYALLLVVILRDVVGTWSRMCTAGVLLLFLSVFAIYALSRRRWSVGRRLMVGVVPVFAILFLLAGLLQSSTALQATGASHLVHRLSQSWHHLRDGGLEHGLMENETRQKYMVTAYQLIAKSPWTGWGPGGFYRESNSMRYHEHKPADLFDSPSNHYLMIAVDFGLLVLFLNMVLLLTPIVAGFVSLRNQEDGALRFKVLMLLCSSILFAIVIAFVPPSYFAGVVWLWTAQLAMLLNMAESNGVVMKAPWLHDYRTYVLIVSVLIALVVAGANFQSAFGDQFGYASRIQHPWWGR